MRLSFITFTGIDIRIGKMINVLAKNGTERLIDKVVSVKQREGLTGSSNSTGA